MTEQQTEAAPSRVDAHAMAQHGWDCGRDSMGPAAGLAESPDRGDPAATFDISVSIGMRSWRSPEYLRLHGLTDASSEETHDDWLSRVHPDDRDAAERRLLDSLKGTGDRYESEYRIVRPVDGAIRWIHATAVIHRDAAGKALRLVGEHSDITARKCAEAVRDAQPQASMPASR